MGKNIALVVCLLVVCIPDLSGQSRALDSLKRELSNAVSDTSKILVYQAIAKEAVGSDSAMAMLYAKKALSLSESKHLPKLFLISLKVQGDVLIGQSKYSEARHWFHKVLQSPDIAKNPRMTLDAYDGLLQSFIRTSAFDSGKFYFDKAFPLAVSLHDVNSQAHLYATLGSLYLGSQDRQNALKNYIQASELYEQSKNADGLRSAFNNIGNIEYLLKNYDKAIEYALRAKTSASKRQDFSSLNYSNKLLGRIYRMQKKHEDALIVYRESLSYYKQTGSSHDLGEVYLSIGNIYFDQSKMKDAIAQYTEALRYTKKTHELVTTGYIYFAIATAYNELKQSEKAFGYVDSVLLMSKVAPNPYSVLDSYELMSLMYEDKGDFKNALRIRKKHSRMNDSIVAAENRSVLDELEAKYDNQKKRNEIEDLQTKSQLNELRIDRQQIIIVSAIAVALFGALFAFYFYKNRTRKAESEVKELNARISETRQMALRLQMNPHFIFNCITSIDALIVQDQRKRASEFLNKFAQLLRQILENSQHSLIALDKDLASLTLYIELEQLRFESGFRYVLDVSDDLLAQSPMIPPLLFQPFVENAILHGMRHKEGPKELLIRISAEGDNKIVAVIRDNGIGRARSGEINAKSNPEHTSMGSTITAQRLQLMEATQSITTSVDTIDLSQGTEVKIVLVWNEN